MRSLLDVAIFLRGVAALKKIVSGEHADMYETNLFASINALDAVEKLEKEISFAIVSEDEMNDRASDTLYSIRREKKDLAQSIRVLLDRVIRNNEEILQEAIITMRGERYCVPVKAEHKGKLPGIVHDTSSTGQTVFVEPMAVVEANNKIRELVSMEKAEIDEVIDRTRMGGDELINLLGTSAWHAAGAAICEMIEAIVCDQKRVFPVCSYLTGEYGLNDIFIGVPTVLGAGGVERIIELELDEEDSIRFYESEKVVKQNVELLKAMMAQL